MGRHGSVAMVAVQARNPVGCALKGLQPGSQDGARRFSANLGGFGRAVRELPAVRARIALDEVVESAFNRRASRLGQ